MPQNIDLSFAQDPNTLVLAILLGMVPAILWLFFWLHERGMYPQKKSLFAKSFALGVLAVVLVLPVQVWVMRFASDARDLTVLWAASEELVKAAVFMLFVMRSRAMTEPVSYALSVMALALGFAGFENVLYFLEPLQSGNAALLTLAGTTRYLGTTLLHALATGLFGLALGFACFKSAGTKVLYGFVGLAAGIAMHAAFNLFMGSRGAGATFQLVGLLWAAAVVALGMFEIERRMGSAEFRAAHANRILDTIARLLASPRPRRALPWLRGMYAAYLASKGGTEADARASAAKLVPKDMDAAAAAGVLATLRSAAAAADTPSSTVS